MAVAPSEAVTMEEKRPEKFGIRDFFRAITTCETEEEIRAGREAPPRIRPSQAFREIVSCRMAKLIVNVILLILAIVSFAFKAKFYHQNVQKQDIILHDVNNTYKFRNVYLGILITDSLTSLPLDIGMYIRSIYLAFFYNAEPNLVFLSTLQYMSGWICDLFFSGLIMSAMGESKNQCGFLVSLTYSKSALPMAVFSFIAVFVKVIYLSVDLFSRREYWQREAIPEPTRRALVLKCAKVSCGIGALIFSALNLRTLADLNYLATVSGCTVLTAEIIVAMSFPVAIGPACKDIIPYDMNFKLQGIADGSDMLDWNKISISAPCYHIGPGEFSESYVGSAIDNCTTHVSISYSMDDFQPEFNFAFFVQRKSNHSMCMKPFVVPNRTVFDWSSVSTVKSVGESYCNVSESTVFHPCAPGAPPAFVPQSSIPCFDCTSHCYKFTAFTERSPAMVLKSLSGSLITGNSNTTDPIDGHKMRYNAKLATLCDVDSDWKAKKLFCTSI